MMYQHRMYLYRRSCHYRSKGGDIAPINLQPFTYSVHFLPEACSARHRNQLRLPFNPKLR